MAEILPAGVKVLLKLLHKAVGNIVTGGFIQFKGNGYSLAHYLLLHLAHSYIGAQGKDNYVHIISPNQTGGQAQR